MKKILLLCLVFMCCIILATSQKTLGKNDSLTRKNNLYASIDLDGAILQGTNGMIGVGLALTDAFKQHQISFHYAYAEEITLFNSDYHYYDIYSLLYGYNFEWKKFVVIPQGGLSYIQKTLRHNTGGGVFFDGPDSYPKYINSREGKSIGVQFGFTALFYYKRWGVGMQALQGFNKQGNIFNIGAMLRFQINKK